ncbi:MAG TPA: hypothetical protein VEG39_09745 [Clostridia bacterium]|nr:hypothetical protein [Clostridia bacterium]
MTQDEYLDNLQRIYERHFNIEKNVVLFGETIDIHAEFCNIAGRTFITRKDVIDRCENYEYCYVKKLDTVTEEEIASYGRFLKKIVTEYIQPGKDHMSTYVTGVIIGNTIDDNAKKAVRKYSCSRVYSFYLKGWCDVRLICIDLNSNETITNKAGKRVQKVYHITP